MRYLPGNHGLQFVPHTKTNWRITPLAIGLLIAVGLLSTSNKEVRAAAVPGSSTFQINDQVLTVGKTPMFSNPPFAGRFAGNESANAHGSITGGPVRVGDVWYWKVRFQNGNEGWTAGRQIRKMNGQLAGPIMSDSTHRVTPPGPAPFVILSPPSGSTTGSSPILVQGKVTDDVYAPWLVSFTINGTSVPLDRNGNFRYRLNLHSGHNAFTLQATTPNPRQQVTAISGYLDGSVIYGSDATRAAALRTHVGGLLKTSAGDLLPFNTAGLPNANDAHIVPDDQLFLAGDVRANENVELTAIQTLFVREHNQIARAIAASCHTTNDEQIFQTARRIVVAEFQAITYNEFLPALLGPNALRPYAGYNANVNPGIATEFSTAAFRIGHTLINDDVEFLDNDANPIRDPLDLDETFFNPVPLEETGPSPLLKYLATDNAQEVDTMLVPGLRNFLFGPPGAGGFDLASLNIQRGRDDGLSDYNSTRAAYGLPRVTSFAQITSNPDLQAKLATLYGDVDQIDLWIGGLSEDHLPGSSMGPTFQRIIADQFERIRDGDRNWYTRIFSGPQLQAIQHTRLSDILRRNTTITKIQDNAFYYDESILPGLQPHAGSLPPALIDRNIPHFTPASLDGRGNNLTHRVWGTAGSDLMRFASAAYGDLVSSPAGAARPGARLISNTVCDQSMDVHNARSLSDWIYGWGQFVDHDLDLTQTGDTAFDIPVPAGDPYFDPDNTGTALIYCSRSLYDDLTGTATPNIQTQPYVINYHPRHH